LIVIEPPSSGTFPALNRTALARFLTRARKAAGLDGAVTVLLAGDARLKELNRTYRRKNKPTDVLSFPAGENGEGVAGDLAISVETAARQAEEHGHALEDELRILTLHGVLHLAGYDHEADRGEMRALESGLRAKLKLPVGLIERTLPVPKKRAVSKSVAKRAAAKRAKR
jgi:probable rRNA maturation factor